MLNCKQHLKRTALITGMSFRMLLKVRKKREILNILVYFEDKLLHYKKS
jgi:hypothetical protein